MIISLNSATKKKVFTPNETILAYANDIGIVLNHFAKDTITLPNLLHKEGVLDKGDIVPKVRTDKRLLDENEQRILGYCFYNRHSIKEIADYLGVSVSTYLSKRILSPLVSEGLLIETSSRPKTFMSDRTNVQVF